MLNSQPFFGGRIHFKMANKRAQEKMHFIAMEYFILSNIKYNNINN